MFRADNSWIEITPKLKWRGQSNFNINIQLLEFLSELKEKVSMHAVYY